METVKQTFVILAIGLGTLFAIAGVLGYFRLPDVYTRLHATGKVGVYAVVLLLAAATAWTPLGLGKGLVLIALLLITGPVVSHTLGLATYRIGIPLRQSTPDELQARRAVAPGPTRDSAATGTTQIAP